MKTYLDSVKSKQLERAVTSLHGSLLVRLLSYLGYRISEALDLKVDNIDFAQHTITIQYLKSRLRLICLHWNAGLGMSLVFYPQYGEEVERHDTLSQYQTFKLGGMQLEQKN